MNGTVNAEIVVGIANRLRAAPPAMRRSITDELMDAVFAPEPSAQKPGASSKNDLRALIEDVRADLGAERDPSRTAGLWKALKKIEKLAGVVGATDATGTNK